MAFQASHRHLSGAELRGRLPDLKSSVFGISSRSESEGVDVDLSQADLPTSPIEEWEDEFADTKSSQTYNKPADNYGSQPYDATVTSALVPADDPGNSVYRGDTTNSATNDYGTKVPSTSLNASAIIIPILIVILLLGFLTWCFRASGYRFPSPSLFRRSSPVTESRRTGPECAQALAADLESGIHRPPRVLSPSVPVPTTPPRVHERGWLFMPNRVGLPNWVRGYRRRSDPAHQNEEDWQLDVNEVGEAPPEYSSPVEEKGQVDVGLLQTTTRGTVLPGYEEEEGRGEQSGRRDEVHSREAEAVSRPEEGDGDDVSDAREAGDEKPGT